MDREIPTGSTEKTIGDVDKIRSYLLQSPPVIENIFKFLPAKELSLCAKVCRSWNDMAKISKMKRNKVYIIFKNKETKYREIFAELWSEPHLALYFEDPSEESTFYQSMEDRSPSPTATDETEKYGEMPCWLNEFPSEVEKQNCMKSYLPTKCTSVAFPTLTRFSYIPGTNDIAGAISIASCEPLILIPSIAGVEIETFTLPSDFDAVTSNVTRIERLSATGSINSPKIKVKCMFLSANECWDQSKIESYINYSEGNNVYDDAIIINRERYSLTSIGMSIAGDKFLVECINLNPKECCINNFPSILNHLGFGEKYGVAIPSLRTYIYLRSLAIAMEPFRRISILSHCNVIRYKTTIKSLLRCNECASPLDGPESSKEPFVIVLILLDGINLEFSNTERF